MRHYPANRSSLGTSGSITPNARNKVRDEGIDEKEGRIMLEEALAEETATLLDRVRAPIVTYCSVIDRHFFSIIFFV